MHLRPFFTFAAAASLASALAGCSGNTTCYCGPTQANPLDAASNEIVQQLNLTRTAAQLSMVSVCKSLNVSAAGHSDQMRDHNYLAETSPVDGTNVRTRACAAHYTPACTGTIPMAELVAEGNGTGADTYSQWATDAMASPILKEAPFVVVGVGHSIGASNEYWTLDLSSQTDASCN